ncbi:hypothetical protein QJ854_gp121 [Moumouvirus goulette]|uniref:Uncharacterized protein n=1 Tax=Moumouvirus goulette TaxID=1247379 RepID=M1PNQ8_9VIRU|nr:hypothetical protein QJ854_gp121 [Moumouvirus goulette]AGF85661.1 hypothetical protein glt_00858 [Moumouvirus goulette]
MKAAFIFGSFILFLFISGSVARRERSGPCHKKFYDTTCPNDPYTFEGMLRQEPIKGRNTGYFVCQATTVVHDPVTTTVLVAQPTVTYNLSTLYTESCGCWVTETTITGGEIYYEYGNGQPGQAMTGSCFYATWPDLAGNPVKTVGFARNVVGVHRDLIYVDRETNQLVAHQSIYPLGPDQVGDEYVLVRHFDPVTGGIDYTQNVYCTKVADQY